MSTKNGTGKYSHRTSTIPFSDADHYSLHEVLVLRNEGHRGLLLDALSVLIAFYDLRLHSFDCTLDGRIVIVSVVNFFELYMQGKHQRQIIVGELAIRSYQHP